MQQTTDLVIIQPADLAISPGLSDAAKKYAEASRSDNTKRAYTADWQDFTTWCNDEGRAALPATPETVGNYISYLANKQGRKVATVTRRIASISQAHKVAGFESPTQNETVRTVLKGIRRTLSVVQHKAAPATVEVIRLLVSSLPPGLLGERDRALLLVGFAGAMRRSEIVALQVEDVQFVSEGAILTIRRSKTDQEGAGELKALPYGTNKYTCPVRALKIWLKAASIRNGPIFHAVDRWGNVKAEKLSDRTVARIIQRAASAAGLDADDFSGHSLRAGLITSAAGAGVSEANIMQQSGHKSSRIMRGYDRRANLFKNNAAGNIGL